MLASIARSDYTAPVNFEWDEQKNQANIRKHGLSFADAWEILKAPMLVDVDDRFPYGEERWVGIGRLQSRIVVVCTELDDETIRIISLRKALSHEREAYEQQWGTDWARIDAMTDAEIDTSDIPPLTECFQTCTGTHAKTSRHDDSAG